MVEPDPAELEHRLDGLADWGYVRALEDRIEQVEMWRATQQAEQTRRLALAPLIIAGMAVLVALASLIVTVTHR